MPTSSNRRRARAELYHRLLVADPPVCGRGNVIAILNSCERRRRMLDCQCRFDANEISKDAETIGCEALASAFDVALEPDDVEDVAADLELCLRSAKTTNEFERDARDRLVAVSKRLERVIEAQSALTDEYSDEVDP